MADKIKLSTTTTEGYSSGFQAATNALENVSKRYNHLLDQITPHMQNRWIAFAVILALFILRMFLVHGFYIVTYVLFIFLLNQLILFLQPKDRSMLTTDADGPALPVKDNEEFRPFIRRLPEFKFWLSCTKATLFAIFVTFFKFFDVPVFWPVLVVYFIILFVMTMRRQIMDMKRFKYVPWDIGKKQYKKANPKKVSTNQPTKDTPEAASK